MHHGFISCFSWQNESLNFCVPMLPSNMKCEPWNTLRNSIIDHQTLNKPVFSPACFWFTAKQQLSFLIKQDYSFLSQHYYWNFLNLGIVWGYRNHIDTLIFISPEHPRSGLFLWFFCCFLGFEKSIGVGGCGNWAADGPSSSPAPLKSIFTMTFCCRWHRALPIWAKMRC